jgi:hypothetical protein
MGGLLNKQQQQLENCGNDEGASKENNDLNPQISNNLFVNSMTVPSSGNSKGGRKSLDNQDIKTEEESSLNFFSGQFIYY